MAAERRFSHYSSSESILFVGEGDFSFSSALASAFGSGHKIVASSLDTRDEVVRKYPAAYKTLKNLRKLGAVIVHGLDATSMHEDRVIGKMLFDRIVFNFPHAGQILGGGESSAVMIREHVRLVLNFLQNAAKLLTPKGQVHITHKDTHPYTRWNLELNGAASGLRLQSKVPFNRLIFPTYCNRRGYGRRPGRTFPIDRNGRNESCTFIFSKSKTEFFSR